jgi:hypothetical protein
MKVELEFSKGNSATAYLEESQAIKNNEPKPQIEVLGGSFTLTKWDKERGLLHYKQVENSMQRKVG